jgi:hypothetical protein
MDIWTTLMIWPSSSLSRSPRETTPQVFGSVFGSASRLAFLLLTLSETALVFSCNHSNLSKLKGHIVYVVIVCLAALGAYIWQSLIARRIDYFVVTKTAHPDKGHEDR